MRCQLAIESRTPHRSSAGYHLSASRVPAYNIGSPMAAPNQTVSPPTRVQDRARHFWYRVSEGMAISQLWSQFEKDARSSYRFYAAGLEHVRAEPSQFRRSWEMAKALFWAILEKLTPARRVLVLLGLILLLMPSGGYSYTNGENRVEIHEFDVHVLGGMLLLLVLLLELADRVVMKRDLEIAKDIQAWLLPGAPLQIPGYQLAYATRPANTVAGDYYDAFTRDTAAGSPEMRSVSFRADRCTSKISRRSLRLRSAWPRKASESMPGSMARLRFTCSPVALVSRAVLLVVQPSGCRVPAALRIIATNGEGR